MVIAVNTRFLTKERLEGYGYFIQETVLRLAAQYPEHRFYFFFDRPVDPYFSFPANVTPLVVGPAARHPLLWKWWYDVKLPLVLKKIRADVFLSPDGFCSLTTRVPQCLVVHDLGFLHYAEGYEKSHLFYYKRYTPLFLKKAKSIATVSHFSKNDIIKTYNTPEEKISVVFNGVRDVFQPLPYEAQATVKETYTEGKEYFIYVGAIHPRKNLVHLLKAFSFFKKRQKSNMKLVLAGRLAWKNDVFLKLLKTYKYRNDVVLLHYVEDETALAQLVASAYAMVYPSLFEGFGVPVVEAMRCGVPVLTSKGSAMEEITEGAALYFDPANMSDIAEQMMLIYKDERLRAQLIEQGTTVAQQYTWQATTTALWDCINRAVTA
jgi:glycosyltransferase involved in cell wall biosynthesis